MKKKKKQSLVLSKKNSASLSIPKTLINKEIPFRFQGENLRFYLSQSLFSSFDIDRGTRLLLKTIAQHVDISSYETCADVGCGIGVLGLSVKKKYPHLQVTGIDRDALAVSISRLNATLNNVKDGVCYKGGLGLENAENENFDMIISNIPAKAGNPVIRSMIARFCRSLNEKGCAACVIIQNLKGIVEDAIAACGSEILYTEETKDYKVFHFTKGKNSSTPAVPDDGTTLRPYIRDNVSFEYHETAYTLDTVFNIPDFDTLSYGTRIAMDILYREHIAGRILIWRPGQGHIPLFLREYYNKSVTQYILAGRDLLELEISRHNLLTNDNVGVSIFLHHFPTVHSLSEICGEPVNHIIYFPEADSAVTPYDDLSPILENILAPDGSLLVTGKSTPLYRINKHLRHFSVVKDKKYQGYRGLLLRKKPSRPPSTPHHASPLS
ncbi:MAG: methyltransferase [Spirochaetales bacterium]|nr:methyltransferase [Spirochaetales bacterium]